MHSGGGRKYEKEKVMMVGETVQKHASLTIGSYLNGFSIMCLCMFHQSVDKTVFCAVCRGQW